MVKNVIKLLIILIISMLIGNMAYGMYKEYKIGDGALLMQNTEVLEK